MKDDSPQSYEGGGRRWNDLPSRGAAFGKPQYFINWHFDGFIQAFACSSKVSNSCLNYSVQNSFESTAYWQQPRSRPQGQLPMNLGLPACPPERRRLLRYGRPAQRSPQLPPVAPPSLPPCPAIHGKRKPVSGFMFSDAILCPLLFSRRTTCSPGKATLTSAHQAEPLCSYNAACLTVNVH